MTQNIVSCPTCEQSYKSIGHHWNHVPEHRPGFTQTQTQILVGSLMGDAHVSCPGTNPFLTITNTNRQYLEHIRDQFGSLMCDVNRSDNPNGVKPIYTVGTRTHPDLKPLMDWYSSGRKRFPDGLQLTPTIVHHWYCQDGSMSGGNPQIAIANEIDRPDYVRTLFDSVDIPTRISSHNVTIMDKSSFLRWIGESSPGFEYKWE